MLPEELKVSTADLFEWWKALQRAEVKVLLTKSDSYHRFGGQYNLVAWAKDRRGDYRYLVVRKGHL